MKIPRYGMMISTITQITLAQPEMSCRRNRSPKTVISNQNHSTKINIEKTSARKLEKVKPPENNISILPFRPEPECQAPGGNSTCGFYVRRPHVCQRLPQGFLLGLIERAAHDSAANAAQRSEHLVRRHFADQQKQSGVT